MRLACINERHRRAVAVKEGRCLICQGMIEPWRSGIPQCARCSRVSDPIHPGHCSRCGDHGHRVSTCTVSPPDYQGRLPDGRKQSLVALSDDARAQLEAEARAIEAELKARAAALKRARWQLERGEAIVVSGPSEAHRQTDAAYAR